MSTIVKLPLIKVLNQKVLVQTSKNANQIMVELWMVLIGPEMKKIHKHDLP